MALSAAKLNSAKGLAKNTAKNLFKKKKPQIGGPAYYLFLSIAFLKDFLDPLKDIVFLIPVVGLVFWIIFGLFGLFMMMAISMYLFSVGVKKGSKQVALMMGMFIGETIPFLSIMPFTVATFILTVKIENKRRKKGSSKF